MSRSRKVEPEAAVNAAMNLFWKQGYGDLGTRQLEEETGITRFTLQTSYGGKMQLFLVALDRYLDNLESSNLLETAGQDLEGIAAFFELRADPTRMADGSNHGCLMLNSMIEFSAENADINRRADRYLGMLRASFTTALTRARDDGFVDEQFHIEQNTEMLLGVALGLNAVIRAAGDTAAGKPMAASIAEVVRGWAVHRSEPIVG